MASEQILSNWTGPASTTEQEKQDRTERMIRDAVDEQVAFDDCELRIFAKGSYANNTNVRADQRPSRKSAKRAHEDDVVELLDEERLTHRRQREPNDRLTRLASIPAPGITPCSDRDPDGHAEHVCCDQPTAFRTGEQWIGIGQ